MPTSILTYGQPSTPAFTATAGQNYPWAHGQALPPTPPSGQPALPDVRVSSNNTRPAIIKSLEMYLSGFSGTVNRNAEITITPSVGTSGTFTVACPVATNATLKTITSLKAGSNLPRISNAGTNGAFQISVTETGGFSLRVGNISSTSNAITIGTSTNRRLWGTYTYIEVPAAPTLGTSGVTANGGTISVSWSAPTDWGDDTPGGYTVQWSTSSTFATGVNSVDVASNLTSTTIDVTTAGTWYVRVFAYNTIKTFTNSPMSPASAIRSVDVVLNPQATGQQRRTTLPSNFTTAVKNSGVYVSTNGFVVLGSDPGTSIAIPSSGVVVSPLQADLRQEYLYTYDDGSSYYIRWRGQSLGDSTKKGEYQIKFYYNSTNVDVYFIENTLSPAPSTTAVTNNGSITRTWSQSTVQTSSLISLGLMTSFTAADNVDDTRTVVFKTSTVTYNGNGATSGTAPTDSTNYQLGAEVTIKGQGDLLRTNYTFLGWSTDIDATVADYVQGSKYTIYANTTFYAVWEASLPVFSDQTITTFGYLGKDVSTNPDRTVTATPVQAYSIIQSGTGLNPVSWLTITKATGSDNGLLSGVPTAIGTYTFKIRANNGGTNNTDSNEISFIVYPVGKRLDGVGGTINLTTAKRFNGVTWESLTVMKRYDGTQWININ